MKIRSIPVSKVHGSLAKAAARGAGLSVNQVQKITGERSPFLVMWEVRRRGAEISAVKDENDGRRVLGWVLNKEMNSEAPRLDQPTEMDYIDYTPGMFQTNRGAKPKAKKVIEPVEETEASEAA